MDNETVDEAGVLLSPTGEGGAPALLLPTGLRIRLDGDGLSKDEIEILIFIVELRRAQREAVVMDARLGMLPDDYFKHTEVYANG